MLEYDKRRHWIAHVMDKSVYVFYNCELSPGDIIVHPETLQVNAIIDRKHAGYFPPEF